METRMKAEEALHTLRRAEEHKSDGKLMHHVKKLAAEQAHHLGAIAGHEAAKVMHRAERAKEPEKKHEAKPMHNHAAEHSGVSHHREARKK